MNCVKTSQLSFKDKNSNLQKSNKNIFKPWVEISTICLYQLIVFLDTTFGINLTAEKSFFYKFFWLPTFLTILFNW